MPGLLGMSGMSALNGMSGGMMSMWPHNLYETWLLSLPALIPYMVMMSLKMMERRTPFTSETFLNEYDYIVGK